MHDTWTLFGAEGADPQTLLEAADGALQAGGFSREAEAPSDLRSGPSSRARRDVDEDGLLLVLTAGGNAAMVEAAYPHALSARVARDIAKALGVPVDLLLLQAGISPEDAIECRCEHERIQPDGSTAIGRIGTDLQAEYGPSAAYPDGSWGSLCDDKAYYAIGGLMQAVKDAYFDPPGGREVGWWIYRETSLGSKRLDAVARRVRACDRAELTTLSGQRGIRIVGPGAQSSMAFLPPGDLERLLEHFGARIEG